MQIAHPTEVKLGQHKIRRNSMASSYSVEVHLRRMKS